MNRIGASKVGTSVLFGVLFGLYTHHSRLQWNRLGREAYLASQGRHFDSYIAAAQPEFLTICASVLVIVGIFGVYELVAFLLSSASGWISPDDRSNAASGPSKSS